MKILVQRDIAVLIKTSADFIDEEFTRVLKPLCIYHTLVRDGEDLVVTIKVQKITLAEECVEEFLDLFYFYGVYLTLEHISGIKFELKA